MSNEIIMYTFRWRVLQIGGDFMGFEENVTLVKNIAKAVIAVIEIFE